MTDLVRFIVESNDIEGIYREPLLSEIEAHMQFLAVPEVTVEALEQFVAVVQPKARLRDSIGLNVRVGQHIAPMGGPEIVTRLRHILRQVRKGAEPFHIHRAYLTLHPFTDGNGRSARALWLWQMKGPARVPLGFLHSYYYQTLAAGDAV